RWSWGECVLTAAERLNESLEVVAGDRDKWAGV
ncbi:MAG: hypothetical protein ACI9BK_001136, partial [Acidimicrobiales bacterium]